MGIRLVASVAVPLVVCAAASGRARAAPGDDLRQEVDVLALHLDDGDRLSIGLLAGSGLGGGPWHDTIRGVRAGYYLSDGVVLGAELRDIDARDRLADAHLPLAAWIAAHPPPRRRAAGLDLELRPALGKVAAGGRVFRFDVVASAGVSAIWTDAVHPAASLGLGVRVRLTGRVRLDLGLHDDVYRQPRAAARALAAGAPVAPAGPDTIHALEVRAGVSILFPREPGYRCTAGSHRYRRNPLDDQPAI
jgi:hypothetical protein